MIAMTVGTALGVSVLSALGILALLAIFAKSSVRQRCSVCGLLIRRAFYRRGLGKNSMIYCPQCHEALRRHNASKVGKRLAPVPVT